MTFSLHRASPESKAKTPCRLNKGHSEGCLSKMAFYQENMEVHFWMQKLIDMS